jgi:nucleotide-binding universal stress UspA family protein
MTLPIDTLNAIDALKAGSEVLVKRARQGRFSFHGWEYTTVNVTRTTKARIFVKSLYDGASEREFNRSDLKERGKDRWNAPELIVDPALIAKARAEETAEKARKVLEQAGLVSLLGLRKRFEDSLSSRSDEEIQALIAAASALGVSAA